MCFATLHLVSVIAFIVTYLISISGGGDDPFVFVAWTGSAAAGGSVGKPVEVDHSDAFALNAALALAIAGAIAAAAHALQGYLAYGPREVPRREEPNVFTHVSGPVEREPLDGELDASDRPGEHSAPFLQWTRANINPVRPLADGVVLSLVWMTVARASAVTRVMDLVNTFVLTTAWTMSGLMLELILRPQPRTNRGERGAVKPTRFRESGGILVVVMFLTFVLFGFCVATPFQAFLREEADPPVWVFFAFFGVLAWLLVRAAIPLKHIVFGPRRYNEVQLWYSFVTFAVVLWAQWSFVGGLA